MRGFVAEGERYRAILEPAEARILISLGDQLSQLYADGLAGDPLAEQALTRVLPDAYRDDEEAAAEWRELSRRGLIERKAGFAAAFTGPLRAVANSTTPTAVTLTEGEAIDWMRAIGDLRLILAERLGIVVDGDEGQGGPEGAAELYAWLAWMQDDLVRVLDAPR